MTPEQVSSDPVQPTRDLEAVALEACPFCDLPGNELEACHSGIWWEIYCDGCGACGGRGLSQASASEQWNTRAARSAPEAGKAVVKPLIWESEPPYSVARPFAGLHYATEVVWPENGKAFDYVMLSGPTVGAKRFASLSDAKAAAQADYEVRIISALASIPAPSGAEPVATLLPSDPYDERDGPWFSQKDLKRLAELPAGTKLYAGEKS